MKYTSVLALVILSSCATRPPQTPPAAPLPTSVEEALASAYRTPANRERDRYRHPLETLTFFGVTPTQTVVEIEPGSGWYTEILAPLLAARGQYVAAVNPKYQGAVNWLKSHPAIDAKVLKTEFVRTGNVVVAPEGTVDVVLTFRNAHSWMKDGTQRAAFEAFFRALKPGGVLGVVDHRADPRKARRPDSGYVREEDVIAVAKSVGFKLDAKSEINANPKDTKDYADGVWALPPTLKGGDTDREKYLGIGESDRMTLRFVKPAAGTK